VAVDEFRLLGTLARPITQPSRVRTITSIYTNNSILYATGSSATHRAHKAL